MYLSTDDPSVALRVEEVVESGLVLVGGAPVVIDGIEVVNPHFVGLLKKIEISFSKRTFSYQPSGDMTNKSCLPLSKSLFQRIERNAPVIYFYNGVIFNLWIFVVLAQAFKES